MANTYTLTRNICSTTSSPPSLRQLETLKHFGARPTEARVSYTQSTLIGEWSHRLHTALEFPRISQNDCKFDLLQTKTLKVVLQHNCRSLWTSPICLNTLIFYTKLFKFWITSLASNLLPGFLFWINSSIEKQGLTSLEFGQRSHLI